MIKIFVGGFPLDFTELDIAMLVGLHGDISTIKIVRDKKTRICKGYAFVEMMSKDGAEKAVEALDGIEVGGRQLNVKIREEKPVAAPRNYSSNTRSSSFSSGSSFEKKKRPRRPI
ncbi:RNA recognition motif domain-containing protein [Mucilaginibacter sp. OK098]|uniref:RNA recognition motif domain-containing protein n=1 Tax=Mucilaginibacter sp. OK098 TaxID=1855297 RepID=UPI0009158D50|nr:RNA-binding protein [Mucilaginibacter sp. OK098]SHL88954.1 RNA recognition motif. (a.k.a. RRM, RBD, or RNP domain) [Mucilaginibacter sp. OK098]